MYLKLNGIEMNCTGEERWGDLLSRLPDGGAGALGISVQGRTCSLNDRVEEYVFAHALTQADEEGRRIYERSLQFIFLTAVHRLYPEERVRIRHSFVRGYYIDLPARKVTPELVHRVKAEMRAIVDADLPIQRLTVSVEDAREYFARTGQVDRLRILKYRKVPHFTLYRIDGLDDYFYGEMAVTTGQIKLFDLFPCGEGVILQRPDLRDPSKPAKYVASPNLLKTYSESAEWHAILNCENIADLNDMIQDRRLREFIRVNEALQERRIGKIADQFVASGARLLLIAGPSSSGKTTFSHRLSIALKAQGLRPVKISLDDYYIDREKIPLEPDGTRDFERIADLGGHCRTQRLPDRPVYIFRLFQINRLGFSRDRSECVGGRIDHAVVCQEQAGFKLIAFRAELFSGGFPGFLRLVEAGQLLLGGAGFFGAEALVGPAYHLIHQLHCRVDGVRF